MKNSRRILTGLAALLVLVLLAIGGYKYKLALWDNKIGWTPVGDELRLLSEKSGCNFAVFDAEDAEGRRSPMWIYGLLAPLKTIHLYNPRTPIFGDQKTVAIKLPAPRTSQVEPLCVSKAIELAHKMSTGSVQVKFKDDDAS